MKPSMARLTLVLGLLSAVGPIAIDMYLPALPTIAADLGTDVGAVQLSLVSFFLALAFGQPLYGPLADAFGRRPPLLAGLVLFVLAAAGCTLVRSVDALIALRFIQGIGVCSTAVIIRAIIRDLYTGHEAARLMALTLLLLGISPVLAPLSGSFFILWFSWQSIFWVLAAVGLIGLALAFWLLPETLPPERRRSTGVWTAIVRYAHLLVDGRFMRLALITSLVQGSFLAYLSGSAFFFINVHGLQPWTYSLVFASNAVGLIGFAQLNSTMMRRIGAERLILGAVTVNAVAGVFLFVATLLGFASLALALPLLFVDCCAFAFVGAPGSVLALDGHAHQAGSASALIGTLQFAAGALCSALVSLFFDGTAIPMVSVIAGSAVLAWLLSINTFRGRRAT